MLTQTMPALIQAMQGTLPPDALKQLTQALGNCNQPLTHRGDVNIQPTTPGNKNGVYGGYDDPPWPPDWDRSLIPDINNITNNNMVDMPGFNSGDWNTNNYAGSQFYFPTNNAFNLNNYYGGDTTNIGGNSYFDNTTTKNLNTTNINTTTINNSPIPGAPGPAGPAGGRGAGGVPGFPGGFGGGGRAGFVPQYRGVVGVMPIPVDAISGGFVTFSLATDACKTGTIKVTVTPETTVINNVSGATLDEEDCSISLASNSVTVVTGVTATAVFTPTAASYTSTKVALTDLLPANTDPRAVVTALVPQNSITVLVPG